MAITIFFTNNERLCRHFAWKQKATVILRDTEAGRPGQTFCWFKLFISGVCDAAGYEIVNTLWSAIGRKLLQTFGIYRTGCPFQTTLCNSEEHTGQENEENTFLAVSLNIKHQECPLAGCQLCWEIQPKGMNDQPTISKTVIDSYWRILRCTIYMLLWLFL